MSLVKIPKDAEIIADTYIHDNFKEVMGVSYGSIVRHGNAWEVKGEVEIMAGLFETKRIPFKMKISPSGEILEVKQGEK